MMKMQYKYCHKGEPELYQHFLKEKRIYLPEQQEGHGFITPPFIGSRHQQGYGIGNILGGIFKSVIPIVSPILKSVAKSVGRRALAGGVNVAQNVLSGKRSLKNSLTQEAKRQLRGLGSDAMNSIQANVGNKHKVKKAGNRKRKGARIGGNDKLKRVRQFEKDIFS